MPADRTHTPEEAQRLVLERINPLGLERVSLTNSLGRLLAADVVAPYDNPPLDNSAMDGYAVRYDDVKGSTAERPAVLEMIEDIPAGYIGKKTVGPKQTSRIMTGAPVPAGADTVIRVEDTKADGTQIQICDAEEQGDHIRLRGEDMKTGELLLPAGTELGPGEVAALASAQRTLLSVHRRPTITILSTGDELVEPDEPLEPGKIVNSNTTALAAMVTAHGGVPVMLPTVPDDEEQIRRTVETAMSGDFILSTGGVSVGEYDYIKKVLDDLGAETVLWRVAMKPGKPLFFCIVRDTPYFGLPGNPVSGLMSFLQFVRPAIRKASGYAENDLLLPTTTAVMGNGEHNDGDRRTYLRARLKVENGQLRADTAYRAQGSHIITSMTGANGIVILEPRHRVEAGDEVTVQIIGRVF